MIRNFRHNGLRRFWERGDRRRIPSEYVNRIDRFGPGFLTSRSVRNGIPTASADGKSRRLLGRKRFSQLAHYIPA